MFFDDFDLNGDSYGDDILDEIDIDPLEALIADIISSDISLTICSDIPENISFNKRKAV